MALNKTKNVNGFDCGYWKIVNQRVSYVRQTTRIDIALYKDEATRNADVNSHVLVESITKPSVIQHRDDAYTAIKESQPATEADVFQGLAEEEGEEMNWFADAVDV